MLFFIKIGKSGELKPNFSINLNSISNLSRRDFTSVAFKVLYPFVPSGTIPIQDKYYVPWRDKRKTLT